MDATPQRRQQLQLLVTIHKALNIHNRALARNRAAREAGLAKESTGDVGLDALFSHGRGKSEVRPAEEVDGVEVDTVNRVAAAAESAGPAGREGEQDWVAGGSDGDVCAYAFNIARPCILLA